MAALERLNATNYVLDPLDQNAYTLLHQLYPGHTVPVPLPRHFAEHNCGSHQASLTPNYSSVFAITSGASEKVFFGYWIEFLHTYTSVSTSSTALRKEGHDSSRTHDPHQSWSELGASQFLQKPAYGE